MSQGNQKVLHSQFVVAVMKILTKKPLNLPQKKRITVIWNSLFYTRGFSTGMTPTDIIKMNF